MTKRELITALQQCGADRDAEVVALIWNGPITPNIDRCVFETDDVRTESHNGQTRIRLLLNSTTEEFEVD